MCFKAPVSFLGEFDDTYYAVGSLPQSHSSSRCIPILMQSWHGMYIDITPCHNIVSAYRKTNDSSLSREAEALRLISPDSVSRSEVSVRFTERVVISL